MTKQNNKSFGRLAFERLISNLLSVKVWLFLIPLALSCGFLYWAIDLIIDTTVIVQQSVESSKDMVQITEIALTTMKDVFTSWLKFTGSLVVSVIGVREIWKINKIREDTKRNGMNKGE